MVRTGVFGWWRRLRGELRLRRASTLLQQKREELESAYRLSDEAHGADPRVVDAYQTYTRRSVIHGIPWLSHWLAPVPFALAGIGMLLAPAITAHYADLDLSWKEYIVALVGGPVLTVVALGVVLAPLDLALERSTRPARLERIISPLVLGVLAGAIRFIITDHAVVADNITWFARYEDVLVAAIVFALALQIVLTAASIFGGSSATFLDGMRPIPGTFTPSETTAYVLTTAYLHMASINPSQRAIRDNRRNLARMLRDAERCINEVIPQAYRRMGAASADRAWVTNRTYGAMSAVTHHRQRLMDTRSVPDYRQLLDRLAAETIELANGDWASIESYPLPNRTSRVVATLRSIMAAGLLTTLGLALPYIPGVVPSALLTGIQVALVSAAVTTIVPLMAQPTRAAAQ